MADVTFKLTRKEAMALLQALESVTQYNDVLINTFNFNYKDVNACLMANNKINKAMGYKGDLLMLSKKDYWA